MPHKNSEVRQEYHRRYAQQPENRKAHRESVRKYRYNPENKEKIQAADREKHYKQNAVTQGRKRHHKSWTEQEIMLLWNTDYTTKKLALMLHRTFSAIKSARMRYKVRQPSNYFHNGCQEVT